MAPSVSFRSLDGIPSTPMFKPLRISAKAISLPRRGRRVVLAEPSWGPKRGQGWQGRWESHRGTWSGFSRRIRRCRPGLQGVPRVGTCARRKGKAWMAAVQPLKESKISCGYLMTSLVEDVCFKNTFKTYIIFYTQMHTNMQRKLIKGCRVTSLRELALIK